MAMEAIASFHTLPKQFIRPNRGWIRCCSNRCVYEDIGDVVMIDSPWFVEPRTDHRKSHPKRD